MTSANMYEQLRCSLITRWYIRHLPKGTKKGRIRMANPNKFKNVELAMRLSQNLVRTKTGGLKRGTEKVDIADGETKNVPVVYGVNKEGVQTPLRNVQLDMFIRNDVEGQKKEAYPALRYDYNQNGPQAQWYSAKELLSFEKTWQKVSVENNGKTTEFMHGKGTVFPANGKNREAGFKVNHKTIEASDVPFDVASHYEQTAITREAYIAAKNAWEAAKAARTPAKNAPQAAVPNAPQVPETQAMADVPQVSETQVKSDMELTA